MLISILVKPPGPITSPWTSLLLVLRTSKKQVFVTLISLRQLALPTSRHVLQSSDGSALPPTSPSLRRQPSSSSWTKSTVLSDPTRTKRFRENMFSSLSNQVPHPLIQPTQISHCLSLVCWTLWTNTLLVSWECQACRSFFPHESEYKSGDEPDASKHSRSDPESFSQHQQHPIVISV